MIRPTFLRAAALLALACAPAAAQPSVDAARPTAQIPFRVELRQATIPGLPALQSFAVGTSGGRWLLLTGRRTGLHKISNDLENVFPPSGASDSVYVVDPAQRRVWSAPVGPLPQPIRDALKVANAQAYQDGDWLYLVGGYGMDTRADSMLTFPTLTAVNVPGMIRAVVNRQPLLPHVQQVRNFALKVTGGQLMKLDGLFYLVMGQRFDGLYSANPAYYDQFTQEYKESVQRLRITPSPLAMTIVDTMKQDPNDFSAPFHRRDLNVVGAFAPDGTKRLAVYGGVFTPGTASGYRTPIYLEGTQARVDSTFLQAMSQYDCASLLLYSRASGQMHTVLFGGISLYSYDAQKMQIHQDTELPFIRNVSVITVGPGGTTQTAYPWEMPARLGADARVILDPTAPHDDENDVVMLDGLAAGRAVRLGWLYGGILSDVGNTDDQQRQTRASRALFEVWVTPGATPAVALPTTPASAAAGAVR